MGRLPLFVPRLFSTNACNTAHPFYNPDFLIFTNMGHTDLKDLNNGDVFGTAIHDYYVGQTDGEIWVSSYIAAGECLPVHYLFRTYEDMPEYERQALTLCQGEILDIGAGAGCHSAALQAMGKRVTALEKSAIAVGVMQKMGIQQVICADIFEFKGGTFDTLLMLMNGIGISGTIAGLRLLLRQLRKILNPAGCILFESSDIRSLCRNISHPVHSFYGELVYTLKYKKVINKALPWLFIDPETAREEAVRAGYEYELIEMRGDNTYLAKLTICSC